jgi:hypothetical protein
LQHVLDLISEREARLCFAASRMWVSGARARVGARVCAVS